MHYTLHLTNDCNMRCRYCYVDKNNIKTMTPDTARRVVEMATKEQGHNSIGIIFFGGEPLLHKDLIYETIEYCKWKQAKEEYYFHFKVTTNGLLLDNDFMEQSLKNNIFIAMSHDGIKKAHDYNRIFENGEGTFGILESKIEMLLAGRPYAPVLMVITPETVEHYFESVNYLYKKGFRYLICSLNYAGSWSEQALDVLRKQYEQLADFYLEKTYSEDKFYLSPFEVKISSHINRKNYCKERCELGKKQVSISPDGFIFPCVQFVGEEKYSIGHIKTGIDESKRLELYELNEQDKNQCTGCAIKSRCNNHCGCLNKQSTGRIDKVSPVLCAHERILMPIADRIASKLFKEKNTMFIQKHYNDMFPLISMIEDFTKK